MASRALFRRNMLLVDHSSLGIRCMSQSLHTASQAKVDQGRSDAFASMTRLSDWHGERSCGTKHCASRALYVSGKVTPKEVVQARKSERIGQENMALHETTDPTTREAQKATLGYRKKHVYEINRALPVLASTSMSRERDRFFTRGYSTDVHVPQECYHWKYPPHGTFKANVSASYKKYEWASIGVVIRDHYGVHTCALFDGTFDTSDGDALELKCDAVIAAQEFAIERGVKSLIIESDYLHLINALRNNLTLKLKGFDAKVQKIRLLQEQFDYCDYSFIIKNGNSPAKIIAGLKLKGRKVLETSLDIEEIDKREYYESALGKDGSGRIYMKNKKLKALLAL